MPDKLTDNEIIKDFTEKTELIGSMSSVYLDEDKGLELYMAMQNILILINRLQAENERLRKECGNQSALWSKHYEDIFETAKETIKAEAYKECIEKLKSIFGEWIYDYKTDNLLKELVGDEK